MRALLALATTALALGTLAGCTGQPQVQTTKATTACFPGAPQVTKATVKAGGDIQVTGPGAACLVRFTDSDHLLQLDLTLNKVSVASTFVHADAHGHYSGKLHVPALGVSGKAAVVLSSGFRYACGSKSGSAANCPAAVTPVTITR